MNLITEQVIDLLAFLLPGFLGAGIVYSLTSRRKPDVLGRVIHALAFTVIVRAITNTLPYVSLVAFDRDAPVQYLLSTGSALSLSVLMALLYTFMSNNDKLHRFLRRLRITRETSYPSEWYSAFSFHGDTCFVVLHLTGERRLYGWPHEWPSRPDQGHFRLGQGEWLVGDERRPLTGVASVLIPAEAVEMVEFIGQSEQVNQGGNASDGRTAAEA